MHACMHVCVSGVFSDTESVLFKNDFQVLPVSVSTNAKACSSPTCFSIN